MPEADREPRFCQILQRSVVILFFLRRRPPPSATLFPYTTLFRSVEVRSYSRYSWLSSCEAVTNRLGNSFSTMALARCSWAGLRDRKSTRLNSSHPSISYAVFCLKKKRLALIARVVPPMCAHFTHARSRP